MHKQIVVNGEPDVLQQLSNELPHLDGVVSLSWQRNVSVKPAGDSLIVYALNNTADEVLRRTEAAARSGRVRIVLGESSAFITTSHRELVAKDDDEALWEEMESQLRNHGRVSVNYLLLMLVGGVISASAFTLDPVGQAIAFVGASITSPGFEPLAKMSQGLVLWRKPLVVHGALAAAIGYGVLVAAALLTFAFLAAIGEAHQTDLTAQPFSKSLATIEAHALVPSVCAALAGALMVASLRDTYVVGPLMILALIPAAALVGASLAVGEFEIAAKAAARGGLDLLCVVVLAALIFYWKQRTKHRRALLP